MLTIVLIGLAVVWVVVTVIVVALCMGAAEGDRQMSDERAGAASLLRLIAG